MSKSVILEKSYKFALRIVRLNAYLCEEKREYVLSKHVTIDGTNIGAHIKEALQADSRMLFAQEMSIALRKASRTQYWLELLRDGEYLDDAKFNSIHSDCLEIIKMLTSIVKSSKGTE